MKKIFALLAIFISAPVFALPANDDGTGFDVGAPTQYTDGSPVTPADIGGFKVYWRDTAGSYTDPNSVSIPGGSSAASIDWTAFPALTDGNYVFAATVFDTSNRESDFSTEVSAIVRDGNLKLFKKLLPPSQPAKR